ncbi:DUF427 domain-containing protein [Rhodospirillaceae bacterium SYSU D60014]|uniref:DUF427 domain-containing protein n=1 Tax=Virgifigura deserti TaxID=2268457 RepID=UPI000E66E932
MLNESSDNKAPGFKKHPGYRVDLLREGKRVRVLFNGVAVADSADVLTVKETGHAPVFYFPREDVRMDLLTPTSHRTHCPFKGDASYWTLTADGKTSENAVWSYLAPYDETAGVRDRLAFYIHKMDEIVVEPS